MNDLRHRSDGARIARLEVEVEALRTEVLQARRILDSATEHAIVTLNLGGRITGWSAGAANLLGHTSEDVLGRSGEMFFTPEDRAGGRLVTELCLAMDHGRAANEREHIRADGSRFWASGVMLPLRDDAGGTTGFVSIFCDRTAQRREAERRTLLQDETQHRMNNLLTAVLALATRTAGQVKSLAAFPEAFATQVKALSTTWKAGDGVEEAWLHDVVAVTVAAFDVAAECVRIGNGPAVRLPADAAAMLGLALHELGLNALKHGALSATAGRVELDWRPGTEAGGVEVTWRERAGPPVRPSSRRGTGLRLLETGLPGRFGGSIRLSFKPAGLECHITLPDNP